MRGAEHSHGGIVHDKVRSGGHFSKVGKTLAL
jgi:hypothetical protein